MSEAATPQPVDIADLRRRLGDGDKNPISQDELARRYLGGMNQATVSRWEADPSKQRGPGAELLRKLDTETPEVASNGPNPHPQQARIG